MDWFSTYSAGILRGSLSSAPDNIQIIWVKFMAMANEAKDPTSGRLEFAKGQPYDLPYIATICRKTLTDVESAIESFKNDISLDNTPRITIEDDGTIVLNNWAKYQGKRTEHKEKETAKSVAIEKAKKTRNSTMVAVDRLRRSVNENTLAATSAVHILTKKKEQDKFEEPTVDGIKPEEYATKHNIKRDGE